MYKKAFPSFDANLPVITGFVDESWKNDVCPSMLNESKGLKLFVNFNNPKLRETGGLKYALFRYAAPDFECHFIRETNSLADIRKTAKGVTA